MTCRFSNLNAWLYLASSAHLPSPQHLLIIQGNYFPQVLSELDSSDEPSVSSGTKISTKPGSGTEPQTDPTLTMIRSMDAVSRAATLRNYIDMIQSLDALSRNNCMWLFALCVAVHTPLDAETCASLRSLLRKCASILATKTEMDDEVVMLNILMTISGRYFGQDESWKQQLKLEIRITPLQCWILTDSLMSEYIIFIIIYVKVLFHFLIRNCLPIGYCISKHA